MIKKNNFSDDLINSIFRKFEFSGSWIIFQTLKG